MVVKDNLRIETVSVGTTDRVKLAERNPKRWKLRIVTDSTNGLYIGFDRAVESGSAYFLPENEEIKVEMFKGEIWGLSPTGTATVYIYEESKE